MFFSPLLIDIGTVWHLRLFLQDVADEDTCLAQEAHDLQVVGHGQTMMSSLSFLLSVLVTCCQRQNTRQTGPFILLSDLPFGCCVSKNEKP